MMKKKRVKRKKLKAKAKEKDRTDGKKKNQGNRKGRRTKTLHSFVRSSNLDGRREQL